MKNPNLKFKEQIEADIRKYIRLFFIKKINTYIRIQVLRRDNFQCQDCNIKLEKLKKKYCRNKAMLEIHHKDENKSNNDPSNLISYCIKCHHKYSYKSRVRGMKNSKLFQKTHKGWHQSAKARINIGKTLKGRKYPNRKPWSIESRIKLSKSMIKKRKNKFWSSGKKKTK